MAIAPGDKDKIRSQQAATVCVLATQSILEIAK